MSRAGTKSNQGDDYQLLVALHWLIRILVDDEINYIQAESNGLPSIDEKVSVDDVVVIYNNGRRRHIQVKKNQSTYRAWSLADLNDELPKILGQLEINSNCFVELYSRSPFGDLQSVAEASHEYPDLPAFQRGVGEDVKKSLTSLASRWNRSVDETFQLLPRLTFGPPHTFEEWRRQNKLDLERIIPHATKALPVLESFLNAQQSKLQANTLDICREDVIQHLQQHGLVLAPMLDEAEIIKQFQQTSSIGRGWSRTIAGHKIKRPEFDELVRLVDSHVSTILVTDKPGSGKTCLLLDIADYIEQNTQYGLLFIKGDRFTRLGNQANSHFSGLPEDIVGLCGRLSEFRHVVVIIDSLDVLSINREHGSLSIFLSLIDRLNTMQSITVIAACRSFDLQYDPLLRNRNWEHKIPLEDLDFETVVAPLLNEWGVAETQIDEELRQLLCVPQNLRLFEAVAQRSDSLVIRNAYELHEVYLDEVVRKNHVLGDPAMAVLQKLADRLLHDRAQLVPIAVFSGNENVRRALVSSDVLYQDSSGSLGFGHQTLFDNLVVQSSLAQGDDLASFIKSHPPFPFLRPSVRTYVFHLRVHAPAVFSRQLWSVLADNDIAYHFKRLIVESLAELIPQDNDWPLFRRLFKEQSELFRRLFWCIDGEAWFRVLVDKWLPSLKPVGIEGEWYGLFAKRLDRWMNTCPDEVVKLWQRALSEGWGDDNLAWQISVDLHKFEHWETEGIPELINTLMSENEADRDMLGQVVSRYVSATNEGDDLLWRYITKNVDDQEISRLSFGSVLHCEPHHFHNEKFLKDRLINSDKLLSRAIADLAKWASRDPYHSTERQLNPAFLHNSSWEQRHSRNDTHHADGLTVLLEGIEHAILFHAQNNDNWWQENELNLRLSVVEVLRYFLIEGYAASPEVNMEGIGAQLTDKNLHRFGQIEHELGELIQAGFHLLNSDVQEEFQKIILKLYEDEDWGDEGQPGWVDRARCQYLIWVPVIFRIPEVQEYLEHHQGIYGYGLPEPRVHSWGGWVGSPVPIEKLLKLSNEQLFRLLNYYNDYKENSNHPADDNKGGREMIERALGDAAAFDPERYLSLVPELGQNNFQHGYLASLLEGVANHLRYRFGKVRPSNDWKSVQPEPDGATLAQLLLTLLESYPELWGDAFEIVRILEACCEVLDDHDSAERLTFLLYRLLRHPNPEEDRQMIFNQGKEGITSDDLRNKAINCVRGIAAGSGIRLCNRLLEQDKEPPELLFPLLRHYARDPVQAVRAALLDYLPYLTYKHHSWGWQVFFDIFREPQAHLWPLAERHLYHQYHDHFDEVAPFLKRMQEESPQEAADAWGRIMTLATLSGHIKQDDLFGQLDAMNSIHAWEGAAQVFTANLDRHQDDRLCINGLRRILKLGDSSEQIFSTVRHAFDPKRHGRYLDEEFALLYIEAINPVGRHQDFHDFLDWIADLASRDPLAALTVCECLVSKLSNLESPLQLWRTESLISALSTILREADETDDETLIRRAVTLQDQFLRLDIRGIEDFFEQAGRL